METYTVGLFTGGQGGQAMWILMYVVTIASIRAMGLAPSLMLWETEDRGPYSDM